MNVIKTIVRFLFALIVITPGLLIAQAPVAHFSASDTAICDSILTVNFTDLSTNNPTSWKWYFPGGTPNTSILQNPTNITYKGYGCYTVKLVVKNNNGSDSLIDSNYICLDAPPHIKLTGTIECYGYTDTLTASGGTSYRWSGGATTSSIVINTIVEFTVAVRVYNGACFKDTTFVFGIDTTPDFTLRGYHTICKGDSEVIYATPSRGKSISSCSFLWNNNSTADSLIIDPNTPGSYNYYAIVTNKYGTCPSDSTGITINVQDCTGIENYDDPLGKVEIYPNPNNGVFTLSCHSEQSEESNPMIKIYNVLGEQVFTETLHSAQGDHTINLSAQPNGIYLYRVISENGGLIGEGKVVIAH